MTLGNGSRLHVMTWNVQHANAIRAQRQVNWILRVSPDVVVLTEVAAGATGDMTARWLRDAGYHVQLPEADPSADRYRVLLAARGRLEPVDSGVAVMPQRFVAARVKHAEGFEFAVAGLYVPSRGPRENRNVAKRAFQDAVAAQLPMLAQHGPSGGPVIVVGDLNVVEPGHVPHYRVFGEWEYDFYRAFVTAGFVDAYRVRNPDTVDHSWFGRETNDGTRNGYRFDHSFVTSEHADLVHACTYRHRPRENGLSDHSAMTLMLRT